MKIKPSKALSLFFLIIYFLTSCSETSLGMRPAFPAIYAGSIDTKEAEEIDQKIKESGPTEKESSDSHIAYVVLGIAIAGACAAAIAIPLALRK